jgi:hypothetical protein
MSPLTARAPVGMAMSMTRPALRETVRGDALSVFC